MKTSGAMDQTTHPKHVNLFAHTFVEDEVHIARCDALGISDHGRTKKEAIDNLGKTLGLFFISCMNRGTIDEFLRSRGIEITSVEGGPEGSGQIYVPIVLLSDQHAGAGGD